MPKVAKYTSPPSHRANQFSDRKTLEDQRLANSATRRRGASRLGRPNKYTADVRAMIHKALSMVGGEKYLAKQALENPSAFLHLLARTLPREISGVIGAGNLPVSRYTLSMAELQAIAALGRENIKRIKSLDQPRRGKGRVLIGHLDGQTPEAPDAPNGNAHKAHKAKKYTVETATQSHSEQGAQSVDVENAAPDVGKLEQDQ